MKLNRKAKHLRMEAISSAKRQKGYECYYCGGIFSRSGIEFDHVVPRSSGGGYDNGNIVVACKRCNSSKNNLSVQRFVERASYRYKKLIALARYNQRIVKRDAARRQG